MQRLWRCGSGSLIGVASLAQDGFRYDRDVNPKLFVFGAAYFMASAVQFVDLRQVYSGGFVKSDRSVLDFFGGLNYTHETYSNGALVPGTTDVFESYGHTNRFAALTLGEELNKKPGKSTVINEIANFFPDLQQTGEYRFTFNLGTVTKLNKWLGWQNQFGDIYVSNPPHAANNNDVISTTGLNVSFIH